MHAQTFIAQGQKLDPAYAPSFSFDGPFLTDRHAVIHEEVSDLDGWLDPGDSLKLYELGYLAPGPFLEIGTFRGKSTTVLATALRDAGRSIAFYSLDIELEQALETARATLGTRGLARHVALVHGSVKAFFRGLPTFRPRFVFLDGDHSEKGLARDLAIIEPRVPEGALLLFHDFVDIRNDDPGNEDYGVPQAIRGSWVDRDCEFAGAFGCSGLFRRVRGARGPDDGGDAPALIELIGLDRLSLRLLVSVARPVKRSALRHLRQLRGARAGSR